MAVNLLWDLRIGEEEFRRIVRNPSDPRFPFCFARLLARGRFMEVFRRFTTVAIFRQRYPALRGEIEADLVGAGRVPFWDWLLKTVENPERSSEAAPQTDQTGETTDATDGERCAQMKPAG